MAISEKLIRKTHNLFNILPGGEHIFKEAYEGVRRVTKTSGHTHIMCYRTKFRGPDPRNFNIPVLMLPPMFLYTVFYYFLAFTVFSVRQTYKLSPSQYAEQKFLF